MVSDEDRKSPAYRVGQMHHLLTVALPYVERTAATRPTEWGRQRRQQSAAIHARLIREILRELETENPMLKTAESA